MNITIPQIIIGIISMFIAMLSMRIFAPILNVIFGLGWNNPTTLAILKLITYVVISAILYVIIYGTVMGRKPVLFKKKQQLNYGG